MLIICLTEILGIFFFTLIQQEMLNWKYESKIDQIMYQRKSEMAFFIH